MKMHINKLTDRKLMSLIRKNLNTHTALNIGNFPNKTIILILSNIIYFDYYSKTYTKNVSIVHDHSCAGFRYYTQHKERITNLYKKIVIENIIIN